MKPGRTYWIAVLAQGGRLDLRDANTDRCNRHRSRSSTLTLHSLPRAWGDGRRAKPCRISAFVSGTLWGTIPVPAASARAPGRSPTSHGLPIITGVARQGQKLKTSTGSWSGHPSSYTYGWEDCDSTGDACTLISGASSSSHTVQASDVGWLIRSLVTATNAGGSTTVQSGPTVAVIQLPPANTVPPSIIAVADPADALSAAVGLEASNVGSSKRVGVTASETVASTAQQGDTLTTTNGSWSNSPTSFSYQWQQCSSSCTNITGATTSSYVLQSSDVGKAVDVIVTATNAGGSTAAQASPTAAVTFSATSQHRAAVDQRYRTTRQHAHDHQRNMVQQPDLLLLSVAGLLLELHQHLGRDWAKLHAAGLRRRRDDRRRRDRHQRGRIDRVPVEPDRGRDSVDAVSARQHNTADDQRDRRAGRHADGVARVMVEQSDLLRLPMAGLQQLRRVMLEHYKRNIEQLHGRRRR